MKKPFRDRTAYDSVDYPPKTKPVSFRMSKIKCKGTQIENTLAKALWMAGLRGYRRNYGLVIGKPDFCWTSRKVAVFCDSAFWHGYNWKQEQKKIKVRKDYWYDKIEKTIQRDIDTTRLLKEAGWTVMRFWDFQIYKDLDGCVYRVSQSISSASSQKQTGGNHGRQKDF